MTTAYDLDHLELVRDEYERTKADHALDDGCDSCTVGIDPTRIRGWDYDLDTDELLCPTCAFERRRWKKQKAAGRRNPSKPRARKQKKACDYGHDMDAANTKTYVTPDGRTRYRCRACMKRRSQEYRDRKKAAQ